MWKPTSCHEKEVRKELRFTPAKFRIVEHITYVYACRNCEKEGLEGNIELPQLPRRCFQKASLRLA